MTSEPLKMSPSHLCSVADSSQNAPREFETGKRGNCASKFPRFHFLLDLPRLNLIVQALVKFVICVRFLSFFIDIKRFVFCIDFRYITILSLCLSNKQGHNLYINKCKRRILNP